MVKQIEICKTLKNGHCLTNAQIREALGNKHPKNQVNTVVGLLVSNGMVERQEKGCYIITNAGLEALKLGQDGFKSGSKEPKKIGTRPKKRTVRDKIWHAIRTKKTFTANDIAFATQAKINTVRRYLKDFVNFGYIAPIRIVKDEFDPPTSNGSKLYRLVDDTGYLTPTPTEDGLNLFDPNLNEIKELCHAKK